MFPSRGTRARRFLLIWSPWAWRWTLDKMIIIFVTEVTCSHFSCHFHVHVNVHKHDRVVLCSQIYWVNVWNLLLQVRGILNKLTPEKFQKLSDDLLQTELNSGVILKGVILLVSRDTRRDQKIWWMFELKNLLTKMQISVSFNKCVACHTLVPAFLPLLEAVLKIIFR